MGCDDMGEASKQAENRIEQAHRLALEIVGECRVQLMMKFRFLDLALWKMQLRPALSQGRYTLATDGRHIYFEPYTVIGRFDAGFNEMVRDYLHVIMHCLLKHPFDTSWGDAPAWWLASDVLAESSSMELCGERFACPLDLERKKALEELSQLCGGRLTPGNLYGLFLRSARAARGEAGVLSVRRMGELKALFERDFHRAWPANKQGALTFGDEKAPLKEEGESHESDGRDMMTGDVGSDQDEETSDIWDPASSFDPEFRQEEGRVLEEVGEEPPSAEGEDGSDADLEESGEGRGPQSGDSVFEDRADPRSLDDTTNDDEREWNEISKQVEMDLQTFSKEWGLEAGSFVKRLSFVNRKKHDYSEFLRRFIAPQEVMKISDDEFDYVFYLYGLQLYGNMPLIEPVEHSEMRRIRDLAICIDTSESCDGELVQSFVEHTFAMIKDQASANCQLNVHVIQCDSRVQSDTRITDLRDIDALMDDFCVRGLGGTDFRPAFSYVDSLVAEGELQDLKGVIYFTDGMGAFPDKPPQYETAFVFVDESQDGIPAVPPWASRILIDKERIMRLGESRR